MQIEIHDENVNVRTVNTQDGRNLTFRSQVAWLQQAQKPYPVEMVINLEEGQQPYQKGTYKVEDTTYYVGKFGRLAVGRLQLKPIAPKMARTA